MYALLIIENDKVKNLRILVSLTEKRLTEQVVTLIKDGRAKEAFDILMTKAEVKEYLPQGRKPRIKPEFTLVEDLL